MADPAIFIVEDELIVAKDIKGTLISLGYTVPGMAKSGEEALEKIRASLPDLVLMDIHLAGKMDGIEAAGQIRALYDVPVIYLTAYADNALLERAKITEPYGYVLKPYDERELHSTIEMALYKHKIECEVRKRDAILFAVSSAVEWLLRVSQSRSARPGPPKEFDAADIRNILEQIGLAINVDSIVIFAQKRGADRAVRTGIKYEWTGPHVAPSLHNPKLQEFSFATAGLARWQDALARGEVVSATTKTLPEQGARFFTYLNASSAVLVPIFVRDSLWGFIGFFTVTERSWSADEVEALRITANLFGAAMGYQ
jgi:CheY-like chemotaxis protein